MSRTYKTNPNRIRYPKFYVDDSVKYEKIPTGVVREFISAITGKLVRREEAVWIKKPGVFPKLKKHLDTEWHWGRGPSWWMRMTSTVPQRRAAKTWERNIVKSWNKEQHDYDLYDLIEGLDKPLSGRKPHVYWY